MAQTLLAGDVGGTKTRLALYELKDGNLSLTEEKKYSSAEADGLESIVRTFLQDRSVTLEAGCIGIAGPIQEGRCEATNLPWSVDVKTIQEALGLSKFALINDLQATAYGITVLPEKSFAWLNQGNPVALAPKAVVAAGTGLGQAALIWEGSGYRALPSEGGHCDFAPRNPLEVDLLYYLQKIYGPHVSYERIVSGPGKVKLYEFLRDTGRYEEPEWLAKALSGGDPSPLISEYAMNGKSELCVQAIDLFISIYAAEAGNAALKWLATGGVYLGGGIAPTILERLQMPLFMQSFLDKGRFRDMLSRVPVAVVLDDKAAMYGAAYFAQTLALKD